MKYKRIIVSGRVQGVCYRAYTKDNAIRLGISGYVRNMEDGRVEIFCKDSNRMEEFVILLKKGSPWSRVDEIHIQSEEYNQEEITGFDIKY